MRNKQRTRQPLRTMEARLVQFANSLTREQLDGLGNRLGEHGDAGRIGYAIYVRMFQQCWAPSDPAHRDTANLTLDRILTENPRQAERLEVLEVLRERPFPDNESPRPVFSVDLTGAGIRANPRDYLDRLAFTMIEARRRLGVCLAEGCEHPYFIARYPRQHYCSDKCLAVGRRASKRNWARMNYSPKSTSPAEYGIRGSAPSLVHSAGKRKLGPK